ncbi:MAG: hypothetical protein H6739_02460 [Alphaproteobacteria bacterium]|nr:hypothetical protein [Alphaproteobacteria bacterium]
MRLNPSTSGRMEQGGLVGVHGDPDACRQACTLLSGLVHRGGQAAAMVSTDGARLVRDTLPPDLRPPDDRAGHSGAIAATRSWAVTPLAPAGPLLASGRGQPLGLAFEGSLVDARALRRELEDEGAVLQTGLEAELVMHLMARSAQTTVINRLVDALSRLRGGWAILLLTPDHLVAARDPFGLRTLATGRLGGARVFATETGPLHAHGARGVRELAPGEVLIADANGVAAIRPLPRHPAARCVLESLQLARADAELGGASVYAVRVRVGERLATMAPVSADVVVPIPQGGWPCAVGYARVSGLPLAPGLLQVGSLSRRSPAALAEERIRRAMAAVPVICSGRRVVLVDDALVTGHTARALRRMLSEAGALEVHLRLAAPPLRAPCLYGVDLPDPDELLAARLAPERLGAWLGTDSVAWLSAAQADDALGHEGEGSCKGCLTGEYPLTPVQDDAGPQLPLFHVPDPAEV